MCVKLLIVSPGSSVCSGGDGSNCSRTAAANSPTNIAPEATVALLILWLTTLRVYGSAL